MLKIINWYELSLKDSRMKQSSDLPLIEIFLEICVTEICLPAEMYEMY